MKRCIYVLVVVALTVIARQGRATDCSWCILDTCNTTYTTYDDFDIDGMTDAVESTLAVQYKPILYLDDANADRPCKMPNHYEVPPFSYSSGPNHGLPEDVVSDGTVYYRVRPFGIREPGRCYYIEIDYWFYYTYNQAECHAGYWTEHGHDWEHIALGHIGTPSHRKVTKIYYAIHESGQYLDPQDAQWVGVPQESGVKVFIENGSHASYPSAGEKCAWWGGGLCLCWETVNAQYEFQIENSKLTPLYELNDPRAPGWLDYPIRWPGHTGHIPFPFDEDTPPPFGPAEGDHASAWLVGHFGDVIPYCYKTNLEEVPFPTNFEVSNFKNGQPLNNALYLTWADPDGGPQTGFALMRKPYYAGDNQYSCIAELQPSVHAYTDSCLDGGTGWFYKLETYRYSADPSHKGCSLPINTTKDGWVTGEPCPASLVPVSPRLLSCENGVLRWEDRSNNESGFKIWYEGAVERSVGANVTSSSISNCNTGKFGYRVSAYNQYGETYATASMPCNGGCDGCPFIYIWNGKEYVKDNNLLAASEDTILSKVNTIDFCLLTQPLVSESNQYKLRISEFEREHSFFDYIGLVALDHPKDKKIGLTPQGKVYAYHNGRPPISCMDNRGFDCLTQIVSEDSLVYKNNQPGFMIINFGVINNNTGYFKPLTDGDGGGIPPPGKNDPFASKLTPYVFKVNGNVLIVEVLQDSNWITVAKLYPQTRPGLRLIELASFIKPQTELKLRLSWTRWYSANQIAFYDFESSSIVLKPFNLTSALDLSSGDVKGMLTRMDNIYTELKSGESIQLTFPALPVDSNLQRDFLVVAKGYYYTEDSTLQYPDLWSGDTTAILQQNYPNPFNPETQIRFVLPKPSQVKLEVYNLLGQKVVTLMDKEMPAGTNTIVWDGKNERGEDVSSGVYFYRLEAGDLKQTKKMIIVR